MFGGLGVLAGNCSKFFCLPLTIRLHDGLQPTADWNNSDGSTVSHVVRMIHDAFDAVKVLGNSILLLDRYYLTVPVLLAIKDKNQSASGRLEILTKAKANCTAYEKPPAKKPGRGRPPKKGKTIHLKDLFQTHKHQFQETTMTLYGNVELVRYYAINLLW